MTRAPLLLLLTLACNHPEADATSTSTSDVTTSAGTSTTTVASTSTTTDVIPTTAISPTTTETTETTAAPCDDPDLCPPVCTTLPQNCPPAHKCTGIKPGLDSPYTGTACVPDNAGQGAPPGDLCFTGLDGTDTCDAESMCLQFGTGEGACLPFCAGTPDAPTCADPALVCARIDHAWPIDLCVPACDPLAYDCPDAGFGKSIMACAPASVGFGCILRGNLNAAADGEPCDDHRDCTGPALCAPTADVFGCTHPGGCCAAYCDITDPATCPPGPGNHMCVPYDLAPPGAPPELGLCTLP